MQTVGVVFEETEAQRVEEWRLETLIRAGYERGDAALLASDPAVDVHAACELLEHGCPYNVALRILL